MTAIRITDFSGIAPRIAPRKLPAGMAQQAYNVKPWSGELEAFKGTLLAATLVKTGVIKTIHKLRNDWLAWEYDVNAVPGPIPDDGTDRIYFTGESQEPRVTNHALATSSGSDFPKEFYTLGIHEPLTGPTVGHTGGSGAAEDRSYVYTFVTQWGEESAPSPVGSHTGVADATSFDLSNMDTAPANTGNILDAVHAAGWVTVETDGPHWLKDGHYVTIADVVGMTELNGTHKTFRVDDDHFKVELTTAQTYSSDGTWARVAPYNVTSLTQRIYRTVSGNFRFVAEQSPAATYADSIPNSTVAENELLETTDWDMPDGEMEGLIILSNGMMAGFVGNELCFAEPLQPHTWPTKYRRLLPFPIRSLGSYGNTIVVATTGWPYRVSGSSPDSMQEAEVKDNQPCLSKRSLVSSDMAVLYATANGIYQVGAGGHGLVTRDILLRDQWKTRNPDVQHACHIDNRYIAFYKTDVEGGNDIGYGYILDKREGKDSMVEIGFYASAMFNDPENDDLYIVRRIDGVNAVYKWEGSEATHLQYIYRGKIDVTAHLTNMAYAMVDADFSGGQTEAEQVECLLEQGDVLEANDDLIDNALTQGALHDDEVNALEVNGDTLQAVPDCGGDVGWVIFRLYGDGVLRKEKTVTSREPFVLPARYTAKDWEIELLGNVRVREVAVAESHEELAEI